MENEDKYKVNFINELIDVKHGKLEVDNFEDSELEEIMKFLCSSWAVQGVFPLQVTASSSSSVVFPRGLRFPHILSCNIVC